jgi:hypothetical protein
MTTDCLFMETSSSFGYISQSFTLSIVNRFVVKRLEGEEEADCIIQLILNLIQASLYIGLGKYHNDQTTLKP